jgi:hypothetical protein
MLLLEKALLSRECWPLSLGWRQCLWIHAATSSIGMPGPRHGKSTLLRG